MVVGIESGPRLLQESVVMTPESPTVPLTVTLSAQPEDQLLKRGRFAFGLTEAVPRVAPSRSEPITRPRTGRVRDYIHVSDLARAHVAALRHLEGGGGSLVLNAVTVGRFPCARRSKRCARPQTHPPKFRPTSATPVYPPCTCLADEAHSGGNRALGAQEGVRHCRGHVVRGAAHGSAPKSGMLPVPWVRSAAKARDRRSHLVFNEGVQRRVLGIPTGWTATP